MRTAYLCGPVTHKDKASVERTTRNIEAFATARRKLESSSRVLDPTKLPKQDRWEDYMKLTIPMLCEADFVVLLPGWEDSQGAMLEVFLAKTLDIPIMFSDHLPI